MVRFVVPISCAIVLMAALPGRQAAAGMVDPSAAFVATANAIVAAEAGDAVEAPSEPEQADIRGPIGPLKLPGYLSRAFLKHRWLRRLVAGVLAVGFVLVAFHYLLRKRRRAVFMERVGAVPSVHALAAEAGKLSDAEFYARLLQVLREALAPRTARPAAAMTPRELAEVQLFMLVEADEAIAGGLHERWRGLCSRAEQAEYGRARIKSGQRREDMQLVVDLIEKADRRRAAREGGSEL